MNFRYPYEPVNYNRISPREMSETMKAEDAKKIIATAIDKEVEAYTFYRGIADKVKDPALKVAVCRTCRRREEAPRVPAGDAHEGYLNDEV